MFVREKLSNECFAYIFELNISVCKQFSVSEKYTNEGKCERLKHPDQTCYSLRFTHSFNFFLCAKITFQCAMHFNEPIAIPAKDRFSIGMLFYIKSPYSALLCFCCIFGLIQCSCGVFHNHVPRIACQKVTLLLLVELPNTSIKAHRFIAILYDFIFVLFEAYQHLTDCFFFILYKANSYFISLLCL